jgi:hypothetical protein
MSAAGESRRCTIQISAPPIPGPGSRPHCRHPFRHAATLAPSKGRLIRWTVPGSTPNRAALTPSILKAEAAICGGPVGRHSVVQRDRSRSSHTIAADCFQAVSIRFHGWIDAITAVLKYNRHAEFFTTVIFRSHQMVLWSGIRPAFSQLKHVLAQAGGRDDSLLQAPQRFVGAFFRLRATSLKAVALEKMKGPGGRLFAPEPRCPKSPWGAPIGRRQSFFSRKWRI